MSKGLLGFDKLSPNGWFLGVLVRCAHCSNELENLCGVFDALDGLALSVQAFYAGAHVHSQRFTARPNRRDAIAHVCTGESTTQDEVSVDVWRKK